jgi:hypothetical protein
MFINQVFMEESMKGKLLWVIMIVVMDVGVVGIQGNSPAEAGRVPLPGGWFSDFTYCTNGFRITTYTPPGGTPDGTYSEVVLLSSTIPANVSGPLTAFTYNTSGQFQNAFFFWTNAVAPGTSVTIVADRIQDGVSQTGGTGRNETDSVADCEVGKDINEDGRINTDAFQTAAIYCRKTGIEVLYSIDGDPREGQRAFFVSNDDIMEVGIPTTDTRLAATTDGYALYRLSNGIFYFVAPGLESGKQYIFRWLGC